MAERMTWEEIKKAYPNQWVGLTNIEWKDGANVKSAVVDYLGDKVDEAFKRQVAGENVQTIHTGDGAECPLGALTLLL